jgi:integrase
VFCHPERGIRINPTWYAAEFRNALATAGITDYVRPFHDARHCSLTNGAAAGESPVALMTRAGHANIATTKMYLHLAGVVFPDEAQQLEDRLLGGRPFTQLSTHPRAPEPTSADLAPLNLAVSEPGDRG